MKTIPLSVALELLSNCVAVQANQDTLVYPEVFPEWDEENEVILKLNDTYGPEEFNGLDNASVGVDNEGRLILINSSGLPTSLMLLNAAPVGEIDPLSIAQS